MVARDSNHRACKAETKQNKKINKTNQTKNNTGQAWWRLSIPALERQTQVDSKSAWSKERASSRTATATQRTPVLKTNKQTNS